MVTSYQNFYQPQSNYYQPPYCQNPAPSAPPIEEEEEDENCAICYDTVGAQIANSVVTKCHHLFHDGCLKTWLEKSANKDCPNCRTPLTQRDIQPLTPPQSESTSGWKNVISATVWATKTTFWLTGQVAKGLFNGASALVKLAASKRPLTITEQLAVDANTKLGNFYASKIEKLEAALNDQLAKVELSIKMTEEVYDPSLHASFVRALKELTEQVNQQFTFFQIGQKNFYDEGLSEFAEAATSIATPGVILRNMYKFNVSTEKALQLPKKMADEFVAVKWAIKNAYAKQIKDLKAQLTKQYEETQVELTKIASMKPTKERAAKRILNNLIKKTEEEFTWLMTGVDNFNKEGLSQFNKTIRYL